MGDPAGTGAARRGRPPSGAEEAILEATLQLIGAGGLARLTTKEVARRAGVSEASVFYHFGDKAGLLRAAVTAGLGPLENLVLVDLATETPLDVAFDEVQQAFESFFGNALPITEAVQGDSGLREEFYRGLVERDLGPHQGVRLVASLLEVLKSTGKITGDFDAEAVGMMLVGTSFLRAWAAHFGPDLVSRLPSARSVGEALAAALRPTR